MNDNVHLVRASCRMNELTDWPGKGLASKDKCLAIRHFVSVHFKSHICIYALAGLPRGRSLGPVEHKLRGLSLRANYTDRATTAYRRS
jgi:hypothetical protein